MGPGLSGWLWRTDLIDSFKSQCVDETFPRVKEATAQQLEAIKALFFVQKKDTFAMLLIGHGKYFTIFQAGFNGTVG